MYSKIDRASGLGSSSRLPNGVRRLRWFYAAALCFFTLPRLCAHASDFVKPTDEELKMTSLPGYPGAPAVILSREVLMRDDLHSEEHYERIKVLTEEGKRYANVELRFASFNFGYDWIYDDRMVSDISGRTIHPDGTIIPFTGKPYLKMIEKGNGFKVQEKVFTLPDVEVGSIIEFRYLLTYSDRAYTAPFWPVQDELYVKQAHFVWYPTTRDLHDDEGHVNAIAWFPLLPPGAKVERRDLPGSSLATGASQVFELKINDVPPQPREEFMPPMGNLGYSVHFSYTTARSNEEFWSSEGKRWSKGVNSFIGPNGDVKQETEKAIAGANTPQEKLQRIYAAVMALENTSFTRSRDVREDKISGVKTVSNTADVLRLGRGTPTELTEVFIAMARAAGFKAYAMLVPDRSKELFIPGWMSFQQFDDMIAIVAVDGKEQFFDPGSRYSAFGQLAWRHTYTQGLRQTDGGTAISQTVAEDYKLNRTTRVANLTMDEQGEVSGKVDLTFSGAPALRWRQDALKGDDESVHKSLREALERMLPKTLEVEVVDIQNLTNYEQPLMVSYKVKGVIGNSMGKRMMLPSDIFLTNESATFPQEKRDIAVYFHYPQIMQDAVRVNLPQDLAVEAVPDAAKFELPQTAMYTMNVTGASTNITTRRNFVFGDVIVAPKDYGDLRKFYSQFQSKDQESVILKTASTTTASAIKPAGD